MDLCSRIPPWSRTWYRVRDRVQCQEKRGLLLTHGGVVTPFPLADDVRLSTPIMPHTCPSHHVVSELLSSFKYPLNLPFFWVKIYLFIYLRQK